MILHYLKNRRRWRWMKRYSKKTSWFLVSCQKPGGRLLLRVWGAFDTRADEENQLLTTQDEQHQASADGDDSVNLRRLPRIARCVLAHAVRRCAGECSCAIGTRKCQGIDLCRIPCIRHMVFNIAGRRIPSNLCVSPGTPHCALELSHIYIAFWDSFNWLEKNGHSRTNHCYYTPHVPLSPCWGWGLLGWRVWRLARSYCWIVGNYDVRVCFCWCIDCRQHVSLYWCDLFFLESFSTFSHFF